MSKALLFSLGLVVGLGGGWTLANIINRSHSEAANSRVAHSASKERHPESRGTAPSSENATSDTRDKTFAEKKEAALAAEALTTSTHPFKPIQDSQSEASRIRTLFKQNPEQAFAHIKTLDLNQENRKNIEEIFAVWSAHNIQEAASKASELEDPLLRQAAIASVLKHWPYEDSGNKSHFILSLKPSETTKNHIHDVAKAWATGDAKAALAKIPTLSDNVVTQRFSAGVFSAIAERDPKAAAEILTNMEISAGINNAHRSVASVWARRDPQAAAAWAESLTLRNAKSVAFSEITSAWAREDPVAVAAWLDGMTPGKPRDFAVRSYVEELNSVDPNSALSWAGTISDEGRRWSAQKRVLQLWRSYSHEDADAWMSENNITKEQQHAIKREY